MMYKTPFHCYNAVEMRFCAIVLAICRTPEGMVDKQGRTVLVGRFRNNDRSDGWLDSPGCMWCKWQSTRLIEYWKPPMHKRMVLSSFMT
mmetsp:Transcript_13216/g.23932  ORF Transcript_13216/g.23932 Transcript_13216/m.23932 type:complete len:89 (+) Transcript_13216:627-893(+)